MVFEIGKGANASSQRLEPPARHDSFAIRPHAGLCLCSFDPPSGNLTHENHHFEEVNFKSSISHLYIICYFRSLVVYRRVSQVFLI